MKTKTKERLIVIALALVAAIWLGWTAFRIYGATQGYKISAILNDYREFLQQTHGSGNDEEPEPEINEIQPPAIKGFESVAVLNSIGAKDLRVIGNYLFFRNASGEGYLTNNPSSGAESFIPCDHDLSNPDLEIINYKYVLKRGDYYGLKDIFDDEANWFIPPIYDWIIHKGDTAIASVTNALNDNILHTIYYKGTEKGQTFSPVYILDDAKYIRIEGQGLPTFYDLERPFRETQPLALSDIIEGYGGNCLVFSEPIGIFLILDPQTALLGYADKTGILIEPRFLTATFFENGCAQARTTAGKSYYLRAEDTVIEQINLSESPLDKAIIGPFYNGYAVFRYESGIRFGIIDKQFNIIVEPFFEHPDAVILDGFVLDLQARRFYSIELRDYVYESFFEITKYFDYYVCHNRDGNILIFDTTLESVAELLTDNLYCLNGFFLVKIDKAFYLYTKT